MSVLLENISEFIKMIFAVIVIPNYGASNDSFSILRYLLGTQDVTNDSIVKAVLLLTFGIGLTGVSVGLLKRLLWKN